MSDRLDAVLDTLRARFAADAPADEVAAYLAAQGFDGRQIGELVARFHADPPAPGERPAATPRGEPEVRWPLRTATAPVRVPGPHEWGRFTPEAWGRVLQLAAGGLLAPTDLERLLDRALEHGDGRVDLPGLRAVLDGVGLGDAGADTDTTTIH